MNVNVVVVTSVSIYDSTADRKGKSWKIREKSAESKADTSCAAHAAAATTRAKANNKINQRVSVSVVPVEVVELVVMLVAVLLLEVSVEVVTSKDLCDTDSKAICSQLSFFVQILFQNVKIIDSSRESRGPNKTAFRHNRLFPLPSSLVDSGMGSGNGMEWHLSKLKPIQLHFPTKIAKYQWLQ